MSPGPGTLRPPCTCTLWPQELSDSLVGSSIREKLCEWPPSRWPRLCAYLRELPKLYSCEIFGVLLKKVGPRWVPLKIFLTKGRRLGRQALTTPMLGSQAEELAAVSMDIHDEWSDTSDNVLLRLKCGNNVKHGLTCPDGRIRIVPYKRNYVSRLGKSYTRSHIQVKSSSVSRDKTTSRITLTKHTLGGWC